MATEMLADIDGQALQLMSSSFDLPALPVLSFTCNPKILIYYAGEAAAFEDFQEAIEPSSAIIVRHPDEGEAAAAAERDAVQDNDATELQPLTCPTDLSPKAIALADDHALVCWACLCTGP